VLEGTEEHFESDDFTGVLKNFKASGGKFSAKVFFDGADEGMYMTLKGKNVA